MKMIRVGFLLTVILLSSLNVKAWQKDEELGVLAIGLVVSDIQVSEQFYTTVVGMEPVLEFSLDEQWSKEAGAANERPFSVKMFKMKNKPSATILKLAYFDKTKRSKDQDGIDKLSGVNYLTFSYSDLTPVIKRIKDAGIENVGDVKRDNYRIIFIKDPDGVYIEMI